MKYVLGVEKKSSKSLTLLMPSCFVPTPSAKGELRQPPLFSKPFTLRT